MNRRFVGSFLRRSACLAALSLLSLLLTSCLTPSLPSFETDTGGWTVRTGQAVWTPGAGVEAVAGDYVLAEHPDGRLLVDFSKGALPLAVVRRTPAAWRLELPMQGRSFGGRGLPPARSAWLVLARDLAPSPPPPGWQFDTSRPNVLAIRSPTSGEQLELYSGAP